MTETARLVVAADTTQVRRASDDLNELAQQSAPAAARATDEFKRKSEEAEKSAEKFAGATEILNGYIKDLAATLSVGTFVAWIHGALEAADATDEAAQAAGIARDQYSRLQMAFQIGAKEGTSMDMALSKLNDAITKNDGSLDQFGVSVTDAAGYSRSAYDVMLSLADQFQQMPDGAEKAGAAIAIFGERVGPGLLPLLNQGSEGIKELGQNAATVTDGLLQAQGEYESSTANLLGLLNSLRNEIAERVMPRLNDMLAWAVSFGPTLKPVLEVIGTLVGLLTGPLDFALKAVMTSLSLVMAALQATGHMIGSMGAAIALAAHGDIKGAWQAIGAGANDMVGDVKKASDQLLALWGEDEKAAEQHANAITKAQKPVPMPEQKITWDAGSGKIGNHKQTDTEKALGNTVISDFNQAVQDSQAQAARDIELQKFTESEDQKRELLALRARDEAKYHQELMAMQEAERATRERTKDFFLKGLDSVASGHGKAARAARNIQKAMAADEIVSNTYRAAMGAYAALVGIPVVGPALATAAAATAIAFGGTMLHNVLSGGGGGSTPSAAAPATSSASLSQNTVTATPAPRGDIVIRLVSGGRRYLPVDEVAELMQAQGERMRDNGGMFGNTKVVIV